MLHGFRSSRQNAAEASAGQGAIQTLAGTAEIRHEASDEQQHQPQGGRYQAANESRDIAVSFLRLANLDSDIVDRLSRYESGLWRQLVQTAFALQTLRSR
jgi:hypothetical protein